MIFKRPILSDSQPKTMKNGVPSTSDAPINVYAVTPSTFSVISKKNNA